MAGLIGIYIKKYEEISNKIVEYFKKILYTLHHRGSHYYIYDGERYSKYTSIDGITKSDLPSDVFLAYNSNKPCKFIENNRNKFQIISDGVYFSNDIDETDSKQPENCLSEEIYHKIFAYRDLDIVNSLKKLVFGLNLDIQDQTSIVKYGDDLYVIRDPLGIHPLFICENSKFTAFASERKAFWLNDIQGVIKRVNTGSIVKIDIHGYKILESHFLSELINFGNLKPNNLIAILKKKLNNSIKKYLDSNRGKLGLLFSGGLDSSLLEYYIDTLGGNYKPIIVGMEDSDDLNQKLLSEDIIRIEIDRKDLINKMVKIHRFIERNDFLVLEIGFLLYHATIEANNMGMIGLIAGQGADELFSGYNKYKRIFDQNFNLYKRELNYDIDTLIWQNIENCEILLASHGLEFMVPYLDIQLIKSVRDINPKYLIGPKKEVDKVVLREIARSEGLPKHIYTKKKSALQYSSRIHHVLDSYLRYIGFDKKLSLDLGYGNKYRQLFLDYIRYKINYPTNLSENKFKKIDRKLKLNY